jgi:hypothetical protein
VITVTTDDDEGVGFSSMAETDVHTDRSVLTRRHDRQFQGIGWSAAAREGVRRMMEWMMGHTLTHRMLGQTTGRQGLLLSLY